MFQNVVDQLCNKQINVINEDKLPESCKMSLLDNEHSSENINCADKLNLTNTQEKNNFKTSAMLTSIDNNKITNTVHDSNQLNQEECKFLIDKINSNESNLNSQDENLLLELVKRMNENVSSEVLEIDTQQFMELNLCKAVQQLNEISPSINLDSTKTHTIKQIDLENSTVIPVLPLINELINSETKNNNSIIVDDSKKSEKFNHPSSKTDPEFPIQDQYVEFPDEDQDAEIIAFRAMCEAMLKIGTIDNNIKDDNKIIVSCFNSMEYEPSTSKLNSSAYDISKHLKRKRHQINNLKIYSSDDSYSSPEYSNELSPKRYKYKSKKTKSIFLQNNLKINSKCDSATTIIQPENVEKIKLSNLTYEDKELNCMITKNLLPKVQNDLKCKKINDDSLKQNNFLKENQTIFYYSPAGKVHNDMLNFIKNKDCHSIQ